MGDSASYRIPALTDLGGGVLLAAWDGRPYGAADAPNPNSIVLRRSTDNGASWEPISFIARGHLGDAQQAKYGYSDPSFVVDRQTGTVFAFFVYSQDAGWHYSQYGNQVAQDRSVVGAVVVESKDQGKTWSQPRDITPIVKPGQSKTNPQPGDAKAVFATSGEGIQLRYGAHAGRLVQQFVGKVRTANGGEDIQAYSVYSDDHGATWKRGDYVGSGMDENKTVELSDGRLLLNSRDSQDGGYRKVAISQDGGQSWGAVSQDTELPDPTNNASIIRMYPEAATGSAQAKKLLFTNANSQRGRENLTARVSCDNGETWPGIRQIKAGFAAYSSATALSNGRYGVLYEANYSTDMRFASFDEAWLNVVCAPMSAPEQTLQAGGEAQLPVTIENQESQAIRGRLELVDTAQVRGLKTLEVNLAVGQKKTLDLPIYLAPSATSGRLELVFTDSQGRQSRTQVTSRVEGSQPVFGAQVYGGRVTGGERDLAANPYRVGEKIGYTFTVTNTASETVHVLPQGGNLDAAGFLPPSVPNCRYSNLPAGASYTCTTAVHTITQEDLDRGYFEPALDFSVVAAADSSRQVQVQYRGQQLALRDTSLPALEVQGRLLGEAPQQVTVGQKLTYEFTVRNLSSVVLTSTPVSGSFDERGFLPVAAPNCRWRNLASGTSYTCSTAVHTVSQADLDRGYFEPTATFSAQDASGREASFSFTGQRVALKPASAPAQPAPAVKPAPVASPSASQAVPLKPAPAQPSAQPQPSASAQPSASPKQNSRQTILDYFRKRFFLRGR